MKVAPLTVEEYVREVLPHSATMWSGGRSYDEYVDDFRTVTATGFGRRRFRTLGFVLDGAIVSSCKRYQRELRCGERLMRAAGIGAVFTPEAHRGRGYATAFLGALLDAERAAGTDVVYLFSDIHPAFYEKLGFVRLPSRGIALRADALPHARVAARSLGDDDWPAIERCFAAHEALRPIALTRPPLIWEWIRHVARGRGSNSDAANVQLGIVRGRRLVAYVRGRRFAERDAFALDECAYADDDAAAQLPALVRNAAGDLRKITGWLPPNPARSSLPRGAVRTRTSGITMMLPLSTAARTAWKTNVARIGAETADMVWSADHV
jgi:predicted N-acetyltransferase YhbS